MKKMLIVAVLAGLASSAAFAGAKCEAHPTDKWIKEADFKKKLEADGYTIKKFKVDGNCYEMYGKTRDGKRAEVYFNPVSGEIVQKGD